MRCTSMSGQSLIFGRGLWIWVHLSNFTKEMKGTTLAGCRLSIKQTCLILNHTCCSPPRLDLLLRASKSIITKQLTCVRCPQGGWRQEHQGLVSVSNDISRWKRYNQRCPLKLACWRSFGLHELRSASAEQHHLRKGHRCYSNITKRVCHRQ